MKTPLATAALCIVPLAMAVQLHAADDIVIADFEGESYGDWKTAGEAFGPGPAQGTLPGQMHVDGFIGKGLVNSFYHGDGTTGTLTSPPFQIQRRYIRFLVGGGMDLEATSIHVIIDGRKVRSATGPNDRPGGSETLIADGWDVGELAGKTAVIQIVDQARGGWGHISVDQIVQTDRKPPRILADAQRQLRASSRYLHLPIKNGAPKRELTLLVDGEVAVRNLIELAAEDADWWAPMDISRWTGKELTLRVDKLPEDSTALSSIQQSDRLPDADLLYREPLRGQFHFSPRRGWNNDPNGMVHFNGEYHLFFQHNPYGWGWGNMHWGHAVSPDMVHWQELGDKLLPDELGPMFSGSAVVDWNNTSGLGEDGKPPLVLIYTAAGNPTVQCIAFSTDGRTVTKYAGNPVLQQITAGNRDPKVIWHEPTKRWVMVLYVEQPAGRHTVHFFTSPNLLQWTLASISEGDPVGQRFLFECPDFFPLAVDGDDKQTKWVLLGADSQYAIGSFDGTAFTPEQSRLPGHRGRGFYAAQTFSDLPPQDGRRVQIGWWQTETKGMPFNQSMTIPLELRLIRTLDGPRLTFTPVKELESLRRQSHRFEPTTLEPGDANPLSEVQGELLELRAEFEPSEQAEIVFHVRGARIAYHGAAQQLTVDEHIAAAPLRQGKQRLVVLCDRTGLEVFASDGLTYVPLPRIAPAGDRTIGVAASDGGVEITSLEVHELGSAWAPSR
jgi:sucrose-6-phosphate hydrolase SacC (GH32 family)